MADGVANDFKSKDFDGAESTIACRATDALAGTRRRPEWCETDGEGNALATAALGSCTHVHIAAGAGATKILVANPKRTGLEVYCEHGKARVDYADTVSATVGRPVLPTATFPPIGRAIYQGDLWASDCGVDVDLWVREEWNA